MRRYLENEPMFLANYADGLSDLPLDQQIADFERRKVVGTLRLGALGAELPSRASRRRQVWSRRSVRCATTTLYINGGFFAFRSEIFDYIRKARSWSSSPSRG